MYKTVNSSPAAFEPDKIELFVLNGEVVFWENGHLRPFEELPSTEAIWLREELDNDPRALRGLAILGITDPLEGLRQYAFCRYGDFDKKPDIDEFGNTISEYWDCGQRPCPADGILCKPPDVPNGRLTPADLEIARMIGEDIPNKQIAARRGTSLHTVNTQCKKLAEKIGCYTQKGIASFAGRNNIL
ncbi:MAG: helix-turn-helix transcriptional regulator [Bacteroidetes bacterium]|nr:MAG: helix-turn-helix transcriptional regulator [Bacteroidota bacterium]